METHLGYEPTKVSKSRIKRLRGLSRPQYRLRVDDIRVFYDVRGQTVQILAIVPKAEAEAWLAHEASGNREVALAKVKDDLSKYLRMAERGEILITRHGRPAGVLIGFESEEDWLDYRLELIQSFCSGLPRHVRHFVVERAYALRIYPHRVFRRSPTSACSWRRA